MRLSILSDDPGYRGDAFLYRVLLDGEPLLYCETADEETGVAIVQCHDERGVLKFDEHGRIVTCELRGRVEIRRAMSGGAIDDTRPSP